MNENLLFYACESSLIPTETQGEKGRKVAKKFASLFSKEDGCVCRYLRSYSYTKSIQTLKYMQPVHGGTPTSSPELEI